MAREAPTDGSDFKRYAAAVCVTAAVLSLMPLAAWATRSWRLHHAPAPASRRVPYPLLPLPLQIAGSQYIPLSFADIFGWNDDDHLAAYKAFRTSCRPIAAQSFPVADDNRALGSSLRDPCRLARETEISDPVTARLFFERHFVALQISRLGEDDGFVTGYYEPVLDGSRTQTDLYKVPVYRRPSNLFVPGYKQGASDLPNKGPVWRKIGRRTLVPYYDRGEIEDGAIAGRGLEICWLKDRTDLLFAQIQGSARIRLQDGSTVRINYDGHNGYPYTAVGRILSDRGIIPKDQMSMQKIKDWMQQNPDAAKDVWRQNRAYVFFREVQLSDKDEPVGAQGVPLTPGRSIAVDNSLHVYGTPFFIEGELPIESAQSRTAFHRLMIAQDTGSAIVGPARADLYFGAGADAGKVSGRLRHSMHFVMLVPKDLDPVERGRRLPLPDPRPAEQIARLFPQSQPAGKERSDASVASPPTSPATLAEATSLATASVPLPEPRPKAAAGPKLKRRSLLRYRQR